MLYLVHCSNRAFFESPPGTAVGRATDWLRGYWQQQDADTDDVGRDAFTFEYPPYRVPGTLGWNFPVIRGGIVEVDATAGGVIVTVRANLRTWPTFLWLGVAVSLGTGSARILQQPWLGVLALPALAGLWIIAWFQLQRALREATNAMQVMLAPPKAAT